MSTGKMKNMIVLKDLPSNIIDEAIVILKPNIQIKNLNIVDSKKSRHRGEENKVDSKDYIVNEAQMVISNYISSIEKHKEEKFKSSKKNKGQYKTVKGLIIVLGILIIGNIFLML